MSPLRTGSACIPCYRHLCSCATQSLDFLTSLQLQRYRFLAIYIGVAGLLAGTCRFGFGLLDATTGSGT